MIIIYYELNQQINEQTIINNCSILKKKTQQQQMNTFNFNYLNKLQNLLLLSQK